MKKKGLYALGMGLMLVLIFCFTSDREQVTTIERPGYREDDRTEDLVMVDSDGHETGITIPVEAKTIPPDGLQLAFDETFDIVCKSIKGQNTSLDAVRTDLKFVNRPGVYGMKADYSIANYDVISAWGGVSNENLTEPYTTQIKVTLFYGTTSQDYFLSVTVLPPERNATEQNAQSVISEIQKQTGEDDITLPGSVGDTQVVFYRETGLRRSLILCLIVGCAAFWYERRILIPKKKQTERENLLKLDYAEVISKLSLLVGSGMSTQNALKKISADYQRQQEQSTKRVKKRPAYEEMCATIRRMEAGLPEAQAYREYGRNCRLHGYLRLGELLAQSVRKGNEDLLDQLRAEATDAFEERKAYALRAGEKASTKLVLPMIMMLAIVFIIIIVPAFVSMT